MSKEKRTYDNIKDHGTDMSFESEVKFTPRIFDDRGDLDLTKQIDNKDERIKLLTTKLTNMVEKNRALYAHVRNLEDINEAHKKLNGVLQRQLEEEKGKLKRLIDDRLNSTRTVGSNE